MADAENNVSTGQKISAIRYAIIDLKDDKNLQADEAVFPDNLSWKRANSIRRGDLTSLRDFTQSILQDDATIKITVGPGEVRALLCWSNGEEGADGHVYASPNVAGDMGIAALEAIFNSKIADLANPSPARVEERAIQKVLDDASVDGNGVIQAAYIGKSGERYKVLAPVERIEVAALTSTPDATSYHQSYSWDAVNSYLEERLQWEDHSDFSFEVFFMNGSVHAGKISLSAENPIVDLAEHIREHIKDGEKWHLTTLDLSQTEPIPAPDDWIVAWDYRTGRIRDLEQRIYLATLDRMPEPPLPTPLKT